MKLQSLPAQIVHSPERDRYCIVFNEYGTDGLMSVTLDEALKISRDAARQIPDYEDMRSDSECLTDFMMVHWAWFEPVME